MRERKHEETFQNEAEETRTNLSKCGKGNKMRQRKHDKTFLNEAKETKRGKGNMNNL